MVRRNFGFLFLCVNIINVIQNFVKLFTAQKTSFQCPHCPAGHLCCGKVLQVSQKKKV